MKTQRLVVLTFFLILSFVTKNIYAREGYADAVEKAIDSVIKVFTEEYQNLNTVITYNPFTNKLEKVDEGASLTPSGLGSGIVLDKQGYIVTNYHVIKGADKILIQLPDFNQDIEATVVGYDAESDIALLKIPVDESEIEESLEPALVANSDKLRVGDIVLAIGNPFGLGKTVTQGIVSAKNRNNLGINTFEDFLQIDAAINVGNSGGALIDTDGYIVGINSVIYSADGSFSGLAFAIPSNMLLNIVEQIKKYGHPIRGWIGIQIAQLNQAVSKSLNVKNGVVVTSVLENGPAFRAGVEAGDIIMSVNDQTVKNVRSLINKITAINPDEKAEIKVKRGTITKQITVNVRQRPNFKN